MKPIFALLVLLLTFSSLGFCLPPSDGGAHTRADEYKAVIQKIRLQVAKDHSWWNEEKDAWAHWNEGHKNADIKRVDGAPYITGVITEPIRGGLYRVTYMGNAINEKGEATGSFYNPNPKQELFKDTDGKIKLKIGPSGGGYTIRREVISRDAQIVSVEESNEKHYFECEPSSRGYSFCDPKAVLAYQYNAEDLRICRVYNDSGEPVSGIPQYGLISQIFRKDKETIEDVTVQNLVTGETMPMNRAMAIGLTKMNRQVRTTWKKVEPHHYLVYRGKSQLRFEGPVCDELMNPSNVEGILALGPYIDSFTGF